MRIVPPLLTNSPIAGGLGRIGYICKEIMTDVSRELSPYKITRTMKKTLLFIALSLLLSPSLQACDDRGKEEASSENQAPRSEAPDETEAQILFAIMQDRLSDEFMSAIQNFEGDGDLWGDGSCCFVEIDRHVSDLQITTPNSATASIERILYDIEEGKKISPTHHTVQMIKEREIWCIDNIDGGMKEAFLGHPIPAPEE